ncbi:hypothetical protein PBRA_001649 [Plasmodiophora brassicae]|nr:hypothetical protein PBRA_001649 [Plasmodiophora brassicae]
MQTPTRQARRRTLRRRDRSRAKRTDEGRSLSARPDAGMPLPAKAEGDRPVVPAVVAPASTPLQRISEVLLEYSSVPPHCLVASERRPGVVLLKEVARSSPEFTACQDLVDIGMATRASACIISRIVKIFSYHRHSVWAQWRQGLPVGHIVGNRMPAQERSRYVFMLHSADPKTLCSIAERGSFDGLSDQYDLLFSSSLEAFSQLIQPRTRQRKLQRQQQHGPRHRAIACCIRLTRVLDRSESLDSLLDEHRRSRATWAREFDLVRTTSNPCHIMALDRSVCTPVYIFDYSLASTLYNAADS